MLTLANRHQLMIGTVLALLIVTTRNEHFITLHTLPAASWAAFFLAGVYLRPLWVLPAMLAFVWGLDFFPHLASGASLAEIVSGGHAFCLTLAYFFLVPAYGALWFAGRWYAGQHRFQWRTLLPLVGAALAGVTLCEVISSGGFYFFSGRFADTTLVEFGSRLMRFFPASVQAFAFYLVSGAAVHALFSATRGAPGTRKPTAA